MAGWKPRVGRAAGAAMLAVALAAGCSTLSQQSATLTVLNQSSQPLCSLYIVPSDAEMPGTEQLSGQQVNAGEHVTFTDIPSGLYNLRAEGCQTGYFAIRYDQALRGEVEWTVVDE